MLTVRELLDDLDLVPLAGEEGLDQPLRWVHISELEDPTPWLSGGELLLSTGLALQDEEAQRRFVARLADQHLAGFGLGLGFTHDRVPAALLDAAREHGLPVFEIPYALPFIAITERAFSRLVNEHYALLRRSLAAHEKLQRLVLAERGLDAIAGALASLIGGTALVVGPRGERLVERTFRRPLEEEARASLCAETAAHAPRAFAPAHPDLAGRALALPVVADGGASRARAWLVAVKDDGPPTHGLGELDRLVLHQTVTIVALELLRRQVADDTRRELAGDLLAEVAGGAVAGTELAGRLAPFGLGEAVAALVLDRPDAPLAAALREEAVPGLAAAVGRRACALFEVGGMEPEEVEALAERLRARAAGGRAVSGGLGRPVDPQDARRAYHEARCALEARELGVGGDGPGPGLATHRDLGSFQLLLSLQDAEALELFCDSVLGPLENAGGPASGGNAAAGGRAPSPREEGYGGELMRSLEAFIEANGQWERAARAIPCHRHTLRYRVRRIEELTGRDLSSARNRIELWLALRGRELIRTNTSTTNRRATR